MAEVVPDRMATLVLFSASDAQLPRTDSLPLPPPLESMCTDTTTRHGPAVAGARAPAWGGCGGGRGPSSIDIALSAFGNVGSS